MNLQRRICAMVPVKNTHCAKQRLAPVLCASRRRQLALAMLADVLATLAAVLFAPASRPEAIESIPE